MSDVDPRKNTVIVGLSGGVDSAVTALLLQQQGFRVEGLFMRNWEDDDSDTHCTAEADLADAAQVCETLNIPLHQVNFAARYKQQVFDDCLREFAAGRTPNPDVLCNREIKFNAFLDHALRLGADLVATGHYARIRRGPDGAELHRGLDARKDQSYFLHLVREEALARTLFPLGELEKTVVRRMAEDAGFDNFEKKDSTGICFIGERDFADFLSRYVQAEPGIIATVDGHVVGEHRGLSFYTLGQRQGLGIGGRPGSSGPWYVVDKDMPGNRLIVAEGHQHPALFAPALQTEPVSWINGPPAETTFRCSAQIRYRQPAQACTVTQDADGCCGVRFDRPQRAITPGQSVVFYRDSHCLGGGIIVTPTDTAGQQREHTTQA